MAKSIIIIGAGIAGLSAGCYARMNGYDITIFELHSLPGGLCTAWERKGYTFDGCIHYLFGSGPGQPFYQTWVELGAVQDRPMVHHDEFMQIVGTERRASHRLQRSRPARSPHEVSGSGRRTAHRVVCRRHPHVHRV